MTTLIVITIVLLIELAFLGRPAGWRIWNLLAKRQKPYGNLSRDAFSKSEAGAAESPLSRKRIQNRPKISNPLKM